MGLMSTVSASELPDSTVLPCCQYVGALVAMQQGNRFFGEDPDCPTLDLGGKICRGKVLCRDLVREVREGGREAKGQTHVGPHWQGAATCDSKKIL